MSGPGKISDKIFYEIVAFLGRILFFSIARVKIVYSHEPPRTGGFILASNHISHFDPPLLGAHFPRYTDWIAMRELFTFKSTAAFFRKIGCIEVDRSGNDRSALRIALKRLKAGRVIGIFPEGGLRDGAASALAGAAFQSGAAMLAAHSGAPFVPVVILGTDRLYNYRNALPWRRAPIWIGIGAPVSPRADLPRDAAREQLNADLSAAWIAIKDDLCARFSLTPDDLPHSPQQRMAER